MSGSLYWIRWKKRARHGGGWTSWHAKHHGDNDCLCGMIAPFERQDFQLSDNPRVQGDEPADAPLCEGCWMRFEYPLDWKLRMEQRRAGRTAPAQPQEPRP